MGTGKSKVVADRIRYGLESQGWRNILIAAPASVLGSWRDQLMEHTELPCRLLRGPKAKRLAMLAAGPGVYVINYEGLRVLAPELLRINWDCFVCDESTRVKNARAKQTKIAWKLGNRTPHVYLLTGTPITQSPLDIFGQYGVMGRDILGFSWYLPFRNRYAVMGGFEGRQVVAYQNLDELSAKVYSHAHRVTKAECLDLPPKTYEAREIELKGEQAAAYREMKRDRVAFLKAAGEVSAPIVLTQLMRLQEITGGHVHNDDGHVVAFLEQPKLDALAELLDDLGGVQVVVWARFVAEIKAILKRFGGVGLYGEVHADDRDEAIRRFQAGDERLLVGQQGTGGLGITLTAAHHVVYYSNSFSLEQRLQSEDRCHRIGQKNAVTYYDITARGTVDAKVLTVLRGKQLLAKAVLDWQWLFA